MRMMSDQAKLANARERIFWCVLHLFISSHLSHVLRTIAQSEKLSLDYFSLTPFVAGELRPLMNLDSISGLLTNHVSCFRRFSLITHVYLFAHAQSIHPRDCEMRQLA